MPRRLPNYIPSKWAKTCVLVKYKHIRPYIPTTLLLSRGNVKMLLKRHGMVYIKPDTGSLGNGIFRMERDRHRSRPFLVRWLKERQRFATYRAAYAFMTSKLNGRRKYIVQQGIHLLKRESRAFDFRVMVQQNGRGRWEGSGIAGRLGAPGKIVSNGSQGADVLTHKYLMQPHMSKRTIRHCFRDLLNLGIQSAEKLKKRYPGIWEIGMDIGFDESLRPWLLEVNTRPQYAPFKRLPSMSMYNRMNRNWRFAKEKGYKRF